MQGGDVVIVSLTTLPGESPTAHVLRVGQEAVARRTELTGNPAATAGVEVTAEEAEGRAREALRKLQPKKKGAKRR